jgi:hypothetical protein
MKQKELSKTATNKISEFSRQNGHEVNLHVVGQPDLTGEAPHSSVLCYN